MRIIDLPEGKPVPDLKEDAERALRIALAVADAWKIEPPLLAPPEADPEELLNLVGRLSRAVSAQDGMNLPFGTGEMCDKA